MSGFDFSAPNTLTSTVGPSSDGGKSRPPTRSPPAPGPCPCH
jgi:hypothetical protein